MKSRSSTKQTDSYLLLDVYLGGVSGAILENGILTHVVHNKSVLPDNNIVSTLIPTLENLLHKTVQELTKKVKIAKTYILIDTPLSYFENREVSFEDGDASFRAVTYQEDSSRIELPSVYKSILGVNMIGGITIIHPPKNHTINGYPTKNLKQKGEKLAQVSKQWIQKDIFNAVEQMKETHSIGELFFVNPTRKNKNLFLLGDVVSSLQLQDATFLIGIGSRLLLSKVAYESSISVSHLESRLKSIEKNHSPKDNLYKTLLKEVSEGLSLVLRKEKILEKHRGVVSYVGDGPFVPLIQDSFSFLKNIQVEKTLDKMNTRLMLIAKIVVE